MSELPSKHSVQTENSHSKSVVADRIVFFDGVCGLCNSTVNFLLDRDRHLALHFAPLQGETARSLLSDGARDLNSIAFLEGGRVYRHSTAIVRILDALPQPWPILGGCLWLVPSPIRNLGYSLVARFRYRLFGKHETCRMPTPEDRERMLD